MIRAQTWSAILLSSLSFLLVTGLDSSDAQQPAKTVRIRKIQGQKVTTPEYEVRRNSEGKGVTKQWFRISTVYETAPKWMDQVDVKYYALVKPKSGPKKFLLFRGEVSYVNVSKGQHLSQVYLHPNTIERFGDVDRVAVVMHSNGQLVAMESDPSSNQRWWEQLSPLDGYLLNRMETPFAMINFDNYEAIKASPSGR